MVTAETALAVPALIVLLAGLLTVIVAITAQLRCVAAAREGARAAARGEDAAKVHAIAADAAPPGAAISVGSGGDAVTVTVSARVEVLGVRLGGVRVEGSATAQREPGGDADSATAVLSVVLGRAFLRRARRGGDDRGSGTIYVAAVAGVLATLVGAAALLGKAHVAHGRAESAADLAALAAAQALLDGSAEPCAIAAAIAARNAASVTACAIDGETVVVTAEVDVRLGPLGLAAASGTARAGPVTDDSHPP